VDLVVTDFSMPDGGRSDGQAMLQALRRNYPKVPVILATMVTNATTLNMAMRTGVRAGVQGQWRGWHPQGGRYRVEREDLPGPRIGALPAGCRARAIAVGAVAEGTGSSAAVCVGAFDHRDRRAVAAHGQYHQPATHFRDEETGHQQ
jgi:CheY-like chemotaxis protein